MQQLRCILASDLAFLCLFISLYFSQSQSIRDQIELLLYVLALTLLTFCYSSRKWFGRCGVSCHNYFNTIFCFSFECFVNRNFSGVYHKRGAIENTLQLFVSVFDGLSRIYSHRWIIFNQFRTDTSTLILAQFFLCPKKLEMKNAFKFRIQSEIGFAICSLHNCYALNAMQIGIQLFLSQFFFLLFSYFFPFWKFVD